MLYSTRSKLVLSFLAIALLVCGIALLIGRQLLYKEVLNEATNRVRLDLNAAREIYNSRVKNIRTALNIAATGHSLLSAIEQRDCQKLLGRLKDVARQSELDFAGVAGRDGRTICRIGPNPVPGENESGNPVTAMVLKKRVGISGTVVLGHEFLFAENPELADLARIPLQATKMAPPKAESESLAGMALAAAVPVYADGRFIGVLYGGALLNHSQEIVDRVRDTVFQHEMYQGRSIGTATIFLKNVRISTNVLNPDGSRAVGTIASAQVTERVLAEGKKWIDRAFVVNDWYITAYEPIEDIFGQRAGMLYVGILEKKYSDVRSNAVALFILITLAGMIAAVGLGFIIADRLSRPVKELIEASIQVSKGNLAPEIKTVSGNEIGVLQKTFQQMLASIRERDERQRAESETRLLQFEKQATIGRLAGGVAHEINNPLTGIVTFVHLLLERTDIPADIRADLETISQATERVRKIVQGLLDFSRQTDLDRKPSDVNLLVGQTLALVENQALIKGIRLQFEKGDGLPMITLDRNQMQSVFLNIILNALNATGSGGLVALTTGIGMSAGKPGVKGIEIICNDTGCGIAPENLDKIFDPFFTTKEVGQGTGLGLSVSYGIVERHGGTIRVLSKVGRGSTFVVWLPIGEQSAADEKTGS